jgi:hypothetical protein
MASHRVVKIAWTVPRMAWRRDWKKTNTDCRAAPMSWKREEARDITESTIVVVVELICARKLAMEIQPSWV